MPNFLRCISENGGVVMCVLNSTELVRRMEDIHHPSAVVSAGLGRLLTGASLMASWLKDPGDSLTLRITGDGPIGTMVAVSDGEGNVRGYAQHTVVELPLRNDDHLAVGDAVGQGTLSIIKDLGLKEPYIGQVPLVSGEIAEDITSYYAVSEQTPTVCGLGVLVERDLSIRAAGGFLLQLLPGASEEEIAQLEENISKMPPITELLQQEKNLEEIAALAMQGFAPQVLEEKDVAYRCYCSEERTRDILMSLGRDELLRLAEEDPFAHVECHFCDKKYAISIAELLSEQPNGNA